MEGLGSIYQVQYICVGNENVYHEESGNCNCENKYCSCENSDLENLDKNAKSVAFKILEATQGKPKNTQRTKFGAYFDKMGRPYAGRVEQYSKRGSRWEWVVSLKKVDEFFGNTDKSIKMNIERINQYVDEEQFPKVYSEIADSLDKKKNASPEMKALLHYTVANAMYREYASASLKQTTNITFQRRTLRSALNYLQLDDTWGHLSDSMRAGVYFLSAQLYFHLDRFQECSIFLSAVLFFIEDGVLVLSDEQNEAYQIMRKIVFEQT